MLEEHPRAVPGAAADLRRAPRRGRRRCGARAARRRRAVRVGGAIPLQWPRRASSTARELDDAPLHPRARVAEQTLGHGGVELDGERARERLNGAREHDLVVVGPQDLEEHAALVVGALERGDDADHAVAQRGVRVAREQRDEIADLAPADPAARDEALDRLEQPSTHGRRLGLVAHELGQRGPRARRAEVLEQPRAVLAEPGVGLVAEGGDERAADRLAVPRARELEHGRLDVVVEVRERHQELERRPASQPVGAFGELRGLRRRGGVGEVLDERRAPRKDPARSTTARAAAPRANCRQRERDRPRPRARTGKRPAGTTAA
ncbi:MAG: hypothetical protein KF782_06535 [Labilithrix sp.]|nr:hypothetical protein [Labilithrix sp.]